MVYLTKRDHVRRLRKRKVINGGSLWEMIKNIGGKVLPYAAPALLGWLASKFFGGKKDEPQPVQQPSPAGLQQQPLDMSTLLELIKTNPQLAGLINKTQTVYSDIAQYIPQKGPKPKPLPTIEEKLIEDEEREIDGRSILSKKSIKKLKKLVKGSGLLKYQ